ncbi:hypothetical protein DVU_1016 [Nitratidesulfovibrio vulgaris str. Hildenborough]|uniref:Uncharacterized protein n=1 Tax=Nitratidesulfovibrio vulgaris (strain ATCC 29579 / DSM 644 / CCUG 34227 / NCIMB 8303 / VKM B-1760 / Hildenborough) TaxID=882 RepID=Q72DB3_NITV2|nr:hypothetical protein DVU_1016 [Nitratidesulfovibrio vulgaris str. Hildenborough]
MFFINSRHFSPKQVTTSRFSTLPRNAATYRKLRKVQPFSALCNKRTDSPPLARR